MAAFCLALAAPAATAAVRLGPDTSAPPGVNTGCGGSDCTFVNTASSTVTLAAPFSGVLVRWRIRTDGMTATWRLRTVQEPTPGMRIATGTGASETVVPGAERTFPTRLRIQAGDLLGVDGPASAIAPLTTSGGGSNSRFNPPLVVGAAARAATANGGGFVGMFAADLEADADGDGYGDETQDPCSLDKNRQSGCVTFLKAPKKRTEISSKRLKAKFRFKTGSPAAQCRLDKRAYAPCTSPFRAKLRPGKHRVRIRATSTAGVADEMSVVRKVSVVKS
jgi:hypothetical protein